jgi:hypothetical protein
VVQRNVLQHEIATKQIYREFIALDSLDELAEGIDNDFLDYCFDHWILFKNESFSAISFFKFILFAL